MLSIERLSLQLPERYRASAGLIADLVAEALAETPIDADRHIGHLSLPAIEADPAWTVEQLATRIAGHIQSAVVDHEGYAAMDAAPSTGGGP